MRVDFEIFGANLSTFKCCNFANKAIYDVKLKINIAPTLKTVFVKKKHHFVDSRP